MVISSDTPKFPRPSLFRACIGGVIGCARRVDLHEGSERGSRCRTFESSQLQLQLYFTLRGSKTPPSISDISMEMQLLPQNLWDTCDRLRNEVKLAGLLSSEELEIRELA